MTDIWRRAAADGDIVKIGEVLDQQGKESEAACLMLGDAAFNGRLESLEFLLQQGVDVDITDDYGGTALAEATRGAQLEAMDFLVEKGANIHARGPTGASMLHETVSTHPEAKSEVVFQIIDKLLSSPVDIETQDENGNTPLHHASLWGHLEIVKRLIFLGADVNAKNNFQDTPLDMAALNGHLELVKFLVSQKGESNLESKGHQVVARAARNGHVEMLNFLLDHTKVSPACVPGFEPELLCAARSGISAAVKLLIDRGYSIQGPSSLTRAVMTDSAETVDLLLEHGVNPNVKGRAQQRNPLHVAVWAKKMERKTPNRTLHSRNEVIKLLIAKGTDATAKDADGKTPIDLAVELDYSDAVEILEQTQEHP